MKRKQNRQKKPKSLRFSRYFLRTLIPCLLVAGVFAAYRFSSFGEEHEDDTRKQLRFFEECYFLDDTQWKQLESFREDLTDAEFEEQYGIDRLSFLLTMMTKSYISTSYSECEKTALLLDPETGEWHFPAPAVMLIGRGGLEFSQDGKKSIFLSEPEETEQIIRAYRDYYISKRPAQLCSNYFEYTLEEILPFGGIGSRLGGKISEWIYDHYGAEFPETESAYVKGHQCRGLTWQIPGGPSGSSDLVLPAPWKQLVSYKKMSKEYQELIDQYDDDQTASAEMPEYLYVSGYFSAYGQLSDSLTSRAAREIVTKCQEYYDSFTLPQAKRFETALDAAKRSGGIYRYDDDDWWTAEEIEKRLDSIRANIISRATAIFQNNQYDPDENSNLTLDEWKSLAASNAMVTINGKEYSLFYMVKDDDPWVFYRPVIILNCIILLIGVLLLSLILALLPHLRAKRRYAKDEYRRSLTAALAHDLKSPLTAISGYAENLASGVHPEKQTHYAEAIQDTARYMDGLITNVLDLAKLEQDEKTKIIAVDLIALAEEHLAHRKEAFDERGLQVTVKGSCKVRADRRMLSQAVQNLLDNAFKFTPDGGSIRITGDGKALRITNSIAEERIPDVERLCEAFVKGDSARSNQSGSGLGLSVVQQAARLNRMQFTVESREHRFITALTGGRRAQRQAENEIRNDLREANAVTPTDIIALMREQVNAVTEQETGEASRGVTWKFTGSCRLYARPQDMKTVLEMLTEHALGCVPDGAEITVTGEKNALHIVHPADRKRLSREESEIVTASVRKLVKKSKLCFDAEEQNGLFKITVREKSLLFRPIHFRK